MSMPVSVIMTWSPAAAQDDCASFTVTATHQNTILKQRRYIDSTKDIWWNHPVCKRTCLMVYWAEYMYDT